jgi:hypothetical protein
VPFLCGAVDAAASHARRAASSLATLGRAAPDPFLRHGMRVQASPRSERRGNKRCCRASLTGQRHLRPFRSYAWPAVAGPFPWRGGQQGLTTPLILSSGTECGSRRRPGPNGAATSVVAAPASQANDIPAIQAVTRASRSGGSFAAPWMRRPRTLGELHPGSSVLSYSPWPLCCCRSGHRATGL